MKTSSKTLMKRLLALSAVLGLMAGGTSVVKAANILFNSDLGQIAVQDQNNATPVGWTVVGSKSLSGPFFDGGDSETFCNTTVDSPPADDQNGFFFKPFAGSANPTNSALNDLLTVELYQDNPTTPGTKFILSGYASCEGNYCGLPSFNTNSPAVKTVFFVNFFDTNGVQIATNEFDLIPGMSPPEGAPPTRLLSTPQYTAPTNAATVRVGEKLYNAWTTALPQQSAFVDDFDLEAVAPAGSPVITNQPAQVSVKPGGNASFTVGVSNTTGVTYQWQHANTNISNGGEYSGVTNSTLAVTGVTANDVGHYRVVVSNPIGTVYSSDAPLTIVTSDINPVVSITGKIGDTYRVDYTTSLSLPNWIPLSTNKLTSSPFPVLDPTPVRTGGPRFYRAIFLH
jgi:hypothetical protein